MSEGGEAVRDVMTMASVAPFGARVFLLRTVPAGLAPAAMLERRVRG
jgi:hypothetical protein